MEAIRILKEGDDTMVENGKAPKPKRGLNSRQHVLDRSGNAHVRNKPVTGFTLSLEADAMVDALRDRRGMTRSALVEFLIREEARRERISDREVEQIVKARGILQTHRAS